MLTVWSVCWGDKYPDYCVQRLKRTVADNLSVQHQFKCITDRDIEGVECIPPINDLPGWWGKVNLFSFDVCDRANIYLDLDVVITGSIDYLADYVKPTISMPSNWAASGHGGCQSSVMAWSRNYHTKQIFDDFDHDIAYWPPRNAPGVIWGDQEWITHMRDNKWLQVREIPAELGIRSYKYHCRQGLPEGTSVVVFHGEPKPSSVRESWFQW